MKLEPDRPLARFLKALVEGIFWRSLRNNLRSVYLLGELPPYPLVLVMNHHSFYDGHLVWFLGQLAGKPTSLLIAEENLRSFPILSLVGALEANRLREALRRLNRGEWVAVFPEGRMGYPGPLGPLRPGALWLAKKAGTPLLPVATRVVLRGFEQPEAFILMGKPLPPEVSLEERLGELLTQLDQILRNTHPRQIPEGFREVLRGRRSLEERVQPWVEALKRLWTSL
ncbi:1-acyl-sn-glycerol-3-phosphate acyltransferase [Thermus scotoductus]|uniref:1-acyl-sn-glycerol-3-phosphate acyltransferase n=2 Tax=Thermus TaxID=270 RepID=A0A430SE26_THESC|nr:1-acyl-sn-glycerol-3-phosphate acyltransferase [Thermus scotoductus]RTH13127.1 1-acyl-sn-glycerol-3-phosphate acyltransferase [Thermus scotoductus]RTH13940.1 1-acyl-sn-glycerol-3-phosphate acyltransferase [Thermus scotoductus]RTH15042.1 1-acyl-sn-glycerol-3-phosphate acyltransferase [Thermus scotoductus]RTH20110.1 1-acyl-sn-glycerol-3-phosphate acyltransferase [Thermus scotoductus]